MKESNEKDKIAKHIVDVMMQIESGKNENFENWIENNEFAPEVLKRLSDYETLVENNRLFSVDQQEKERESQLLLKKIDQYNRRRFVVKISSIAAVLIFISIFIWTNHVTNSDSDGHTKQNIVVLKTENPKKEIPKIIVENGDVVYLKNQEKVVISNNNIIQQNGTVISVPNTNNMIKDSVSYSNLVVPKQSTYTIELSDGTVVSMNANSKLRFPNKFIGNTREVTIEGEAFFKVAKDEKTPFIVNYKNAKVEVHGTQFNVNTYCENVFKTFLVEGSVEVRYHGKRTMMHPNQLSVVSERTNSITVSDVTSVEQENIVGWLNDIFIFNHVELKEVLNILSMWYGENLILDDGVMNERITARYKRNTPLEEIIKSLEIITSKSIVK